jgi:hypothetical protein
MGEEPNRNVPFYMHYNATSYKDHKNMAEYTRIKLCNCAQCSDSEKIGPIFFSSGNVCDPPFGYHPLPSFQKWDKEITKSVKVKTKNIRQIALLLLTLGINNIMIHKIENNVR